MTLFLAATGRMVFSSTRRNFLFFARLQNLTTNLFAAVLPIFTVLITFCLTCFHANQWTMWRIN